MREYGTIHKGFWSNQELIAAGDDARILAAYLLTSPHTTILGAFRLPDAYACEDLGWTKERLRNGFETLSKIEFIKYSEQTKWVWIVKFLDWNKPANPNIKKAIARAATSIPSNVDFRELVLRKIELFGTVTEPLPNTPSPSSSPSSDFKEDAESEILIPLAGGIERRVGNDEIAEYAAAYPAIDVPAELKKIRAWCLSNPSKRKTERGAAKFINGWLSRANEQSAKGRSPRALADGQGGTLSEYLQSCIESGEMPIPGESAVFQYAAAIGLPVEYLHLAWAWFKSIHREGGRGAHKRVPDWQLHFLEAVKGGWPKFWAIDQSGTYYLTTAGKQAQREMQSEESA